ncbi:MAG: hypothetical protein OIF54_11365, partial [Cohaesibacter sp.]|nr:hypothetical protein [Cohaesibacter sp.]
RFGSGRRALYLERIPEKLQTFRIRIRLAKERIRRKVADFSDKNSLGKRAHSAKSCRLFVPVLSDENAGRKDREKRVI